MSGIRASISALAVAACVAGLAACGDGEEGTIPNDTGQQLLSQLNAVETAVEAGQCEEAHGAALEFAQTVTDLPPEVDEELRSALVEASANLADLSLEQCVPEEGATGPEGVVAPTDEAPEDEAVEPTTDETQTDDDDGEEDQNEGRGGRGNGNGPPDSPPGGGNGNPGGGDDDDSSGGIGSDG